MGRFLSSTWLVFMGFAIPLAALADVPVGPGGRNIGARPPVRRDDEESVRAPVKIRYQQPVPNDGSVTARIVIPRNLVEALDPRGMASPVGGPSGSEPTLGVPHFGTIVAGVALALAFASIPFALRGRRSATKLSAAALVGIVILGGWTWAYGDLIPPPGRSGVPKGRPSRNAPSIQIEMGEEGDTVQLWINPQNR